MGRVLRPALQLYLSFFLFLSGRCNKNHYQPKALPNYHHETGGCMLADVTEFGGGRRVVEKQSVVFCKNVAKPAEQTPTFANNNEQAKKNTTRENPFRYGYAWLIFCRFRNRHTVKMYGRVYVCVQTH